MHDDMPMDHAPFIDSGEDAEIISPAELAASRNSMNLTTLKAMPISKLVEMAAALGVENMARSRKQDIIFSLLKAHARKGEDIYGDGVLEILQDGFGFLRSADGSYLAGPDDIYISPMQIRRFNLRTGDTISGIIRPPRTASVISLCSRSARSTSTPRTTHAARCCSKTSRRCTRPSD